MNPIVFLHRQSKYSKGMLFEINGRMKVSWMAKGLSGSLKKLEMAPMASQCVIACIMYGSTHLASRKPSVAGSVLLGYLQTLSQRIDFNQSLKLGDDMADRTTNASLGNSQLPNFAFGGTEPMRLNICARRQPGQSFGPVSQPRPNIELFLSL
jgi:hypothetical protein